MSVTLILFIILFILMMIIGGGRGIKSFFTLFTNFFTLFFMLIIICNKVDPIKVTIVGAIIITYITLISANGLNQKTIASLLSVTLVVIITMILVYKMAYNAKIQGFGNEQMESISTLSLYVQLNFAQISICEILIGLLGAIIDVSISISSSMYEIYKSNVLKTKYELLKSGMNIGKDILGTMTNTLLFAYIGGFMTLIIYFKELHYSIGDILNAKVFCSEVFQIFSGGIGIILIIPVTTVVTFMILYFEKRIHFKSTAVNNDTSQ